MKENIIHFNSYQLCNLVMFGKQHFDGYFVLGDTGIATKAKIVVKVTTDDPICTIPWNQKITLSSRFINRPFKIAHPALKSVSFMVDGFSLSEPLRARRVPLLYKMLHKIGLRA